MTARPPFLTRVRIRNYKSIAACDVKLGSLTFLVGPNGSGKSNFLDAIRFVADALDSGLDHAIRDRGGIGQVRRRSGGHPNNFAIRLDFQIPGGPRGYYSFRIAARGDGGFSVKTEECSVTGPGTGGERFRVSDDTNEATTSLEVAVPPVAHDRLYLFPISASEPFRTIYDALTRMSFYNLNPDVIREPQKPDPGDFLKRDGGNLASVLANLRKQRPETMERIERYLGHVVPGVRSVDRVPFSTIETIEFRQDVAGQRNSWRFPALNMSDGTLRVLGILTALLQGNGISPTFIGIEEPEVAVHPAALEALLDAIRDAEECTQVLVTSHSPDLLHTDEVRANELLAVEAERGATVIGGIDEGSRQTLRDGLFTPGEMLRLNLLEPDDAAWETDGPQLRFFEL